MTTERRTGSMDKLAGGVLLSALASGLAVGALGGAGTANATCASISGVNVGGGCTSSATSFSVALGKNATASAQGTFSGAVAIGENAKARTTGVANFAGAFGKNTQADAIGKGNLAIAQGEAADATAEDKYLNPVTARADGEYNVALNLGSRTKPSFSPTTGASSVSAIGSHNFAANLFGSPNLDAKGFQSPIFVFAGGNRSTALNVLGNGNIVRASSDIPNAKPAFNIAAVFGKNNQTANNEIK
jgi:hypothetical protein